VVQKSIGAVLALLMAGCSSTTSRIPLGQFAPVGYEQAQPLTPAIPAVATFGSKEIVRDGDLLTLPDGTVVVPDATGGFNLPNGDRVNKDKAGALVLATGAKCTPTSNGYLCH
jgi:hypothetical protein